MGETGDLHIGDIKKNKESINKTGGINTDSAIFQTGGSMTAQNPYMSRVESLANNGPLMQTRIHTTNSRDVAFKKKPAPHETGDQPAEEQKVRSSDKQEVIKAQPDLKVFSGDVMKKGMFTPKAKEAARRFFIQVKGWAGSFEDGGSGFYGSMGIGNVFDCLYVDGMSFREFVKEQYFYKKTGDSAEEQEMLRNYLALIATRGQNVITLARPSMNSNGAEVVFKNLFLDFTNVDGKEAAASRKARERGKQVKTSMKRRLEGELTEMTGIAYRKARGIKMEGFTRIEDAKEGLKNAGGDSSEEYKDFSKSFDRYNNGMQKLGLKPGRDDINLAVSNELKDRCNEALEAADRFLKSKAGDEKTRSAVLNAKEALLKDMKILEKNISEKLDDEAKRIKLTELFSEDDIKDPDKKSDNENDDENDGSDTGEDT
ncbi:MAG: hypothetical protein II966_00315 [Lachnospiraceae bacterium]|nr:hypothetical protein [Lachnospiraceae bacterium]